MAKTGQNATIYANNIHTIKFEIIDEDTENKDPVNLTNCIVRWALSRVNPATGVYSTTPILVKDSDTEGGVDIDSDPVTGFAYINIVPDDTAALAGKFYHECEVLDADGNPVVAATGFLTILKNVSNELPA